MTRLFLALFLSFWLALPAVAQEMVLPHDQRVEMSEAPAPPRHFQTTVGSFLRVHSAPDDADVALRLARHGSKSVMALAADLDVPVGDTIHVFLAEDTEQFRALQPGQAPMWADGTAYPALGAIYLRAPSARGGQAKPLTVVLDHELVHILLGRAFWPNRPPSWLQEGLAQYKAGEYGPPTTEAISRGMATGGLLSLESLTFGFPDDPLRAQLAYAQSADLVSFVSAEYGRQAWPIIIDELVRGADVRAAIRRGTGESLETVDDAWRSRLDSGIPLSVSSLFSENVLFGLAGVMLLVGGLMRRRQFKKRLAEMEEEERRMDELLAAVLAQEEARSTTHPSPLPGSPRHNGPVDLRVH